MTEPPAIRLSDAPAWWAHTGFLLAASLVFMAIAGWTYWPWWEYAFLSDGSPVSWLSSALLLCCSVVAIRLVLERVMAPPAGLLLASAMLALGLDEQFLIHEPLQSDATGPRRS